MPTVNMKMYSQPRRSPDRRATGTRVSSRRRSPFQWKISPNGKGHPHLLLLSAGQWRTGCWAQSFDSLNQLRKKHFFHKGRRLYSLLNLIGLGAKRTLQLKSSQLLYSTLDSPYLVSNWKSKIINSVIFTSIKSVFAIRIKDPTWFKIS